MHSYSTPYSNRRSSGKPIRVNGRVVGHVDGDTFSKIIRGSRHIMLNPRAIFFDIQSLKNAEVGGARYVQVTDSETGIIYRAPICLIWTLAIYRNYGYGDQVGLALNQFSRGDYDEPRNTLKQLTLR